MTSLHNTRAKSGLIYLITTPRLPVGAEVGVLWSCVHMHVDTSGLRTQHVATTSTWHNSSTLVIWLQQLVLPNNLFQYRIMTGTSRKFLIQLWSCAQSKSIYQNSEAVDSSLPFRLVFRHLEICAPYDLVKVELFPTVQFDMTFEPSIDDVISQ